MKKCTFTISCFKWTPFTKLLEQVKQRTGIKIINCKLIDSGFLRKEFEVTIEYNNTNQLMLVEYYLRIQ